MNREEPKEKRVRILAQPGAMGALAGAGAGVAGGYVFSQAAPAVADLLGGLVMMGSAAIEPQLSHMEYYDARHKNTLPYFLIGTALAGGLLGYAIAKRQDEEIPSAGVDSAQVEASRPLLTFKR